MSVMTYEQLALAWRPDGRRDRPFRLFLVLTVMVFLAVGIILSSIQVPKKARVLRVEIPERVARFITEKPRPKPVEIEKLKPKPIPRPEPRFERKPQEQPKTLTKVEKAARKKAEDSGLLALTKDLSDLIDTSDVNSMVGGSLQRSAGSQTKAAVNTDILTGSAGQGSGGVTKDRHTLSVARSTLDDGQREVARQMLASKGQITTAEEKPSRRSGSTQPRGDSLRSEADVAYVMDKHKSILHSIYRRARRSNPGLQGKIILEITILPSGQVAKVRVKSSDLKDKSLESSLVARIKQFDFGSRPVETLTVIVPVEFLPS